MPKTFADVFRETIEPETEVNVGDPTVTRVGHSTNRGFAHPFYFTHKTGVRTHFKTSEDLHHHIKNYYNVKNADDAVKELHRRLSMNSF